MLLANPHLPWGGMTTWFEVQLQGPGLDAYGATLVGLPLLGIAFNDHLGWTHTNNPMDGADLYELELMEGGYLIEMDFQWLELETWVFNRKGLPLYKRCGFRAVPGTSLLMENYLPLIIRHPVLRPYFQRHDYIKTLVNKRSYGYDHLKYHDLYVFRSQWQAGAEEWEVLVDFQRRQVASISCREWSFGAWVVDDEPLQVHIRLDNRAEDEMVCRRSDSSGTVIRVPKGKHHQAVMSALEMCADSEEHIAFEVQVGGLLFPFTVQLYQKLEHAEQA